MIVASGSFTVTGKTKTLKIKTKATMAPSASLLVYYVRADGEFIADAIHFDVEGVFENQVSKYIDIRLDKSDKLTQWLIWRECTVY